MKRTNLSKGDIFYFYEPKKGKEKHKYRKAILESIDDKFIVARVFSQKKNVPIYPVCFSYISIYCGDVLIKDHINKSELISDSDTITDFD